MNELKPAPEIAFEDCYWYTSMDVPGHGRVTGDWEIEDFSQYIGGVDVAGRTVLDVGCASGFLSFEAEKQGAIVTSFDADSMSRFSRLPFLQNLCHCDRDRWDRDHEHGLTAVKNSYRYCHERLRSRNTVVYGDIFRLDRSVGELVDIALAGAVLEHLNDQVGAIGSIARVTKECIVIAFTPVLDTDELLAKPIAAAPDQPAWANPEQDYTWWVYSRGLYRQILANVGFEISEIRPSWARAVQVGSIVTRNTIVARRVGSPI